MVLQRLLLSPISTSRVHVVWVHFVWKTTEKFTVKYPLLVTYFLSAVGPFHIASFGVSFYCNQVSDSIFFQDHFTF